MPKARAHSRANYVKRLVAHPCESTVAPQQRKDLRQRKAMCACACVLLLV